MIRRLAVHSSAFLGVCALLVLCVVCASLFPPYRSHDQIWRGYYTLLAEEPEGAVDALAEAGLGPVVSMETETVLWSDFESVREVPLREVLASRRAEDPRLDPYTRRVGRYFTDEEGGVGRSGPGGGRQRIFVASQVPVLRFAGRLRDVSRGSGGGWTLADADYLAVGLVVFLSAAFLALLILVRRWSAAHGWLLAAYLPWLPVLILGGYVDLFSFFILFSGWYLLFDGGRERLVQYLLYRWREPRFFGMGGRLLYLAVGLVSCVLIRIPMDDPGRDIAFVLLPALADLSLFAIYGMSRLFVFRTASHHSVFVPVSLRSPKERDGLRRRFVLLAALPVLAAPFLSQIGPPVSRAEIPVPRRVPGTRGYGWDVLGELSAPPGSEDAAAAELPNVADYLAHAAYQTGLVYGMEYHLPARNERLEIAVFTEDESTDRIVKSSRLVATFGDSWLRERLSSLPVGSVARMLLDQRGAVRVRLSPRRGSTKVIPWRKGLVVVLFGCFLAFCFEFVAEPVISYVVKIQAFRKTRKAA